MLFIRKGLPLLAALALAALLAACSGDSGGNSTTGSPNPPDKVTFMAGFKPQADLPFVGAYVAKEKGFFSDENLDVDIQHVATPGDNFKFLATGQVQFSTADASAVLQRRTDDPPLPIVAIALIGQKGQQGFAVLASSGIATPADWKGKTAGYKGSDVTPDYLAILAATGVDRSAVKEVHIGFDPQVLTQGQVDVYPVFTSNEPDTLRRAGYDVKVFEASDYGVPTLGLTYVTTEDYASKHPDVVRRFLRAVLRGIYYADKYPDEAIQTVLKYAPDADPAHQKFMLETELAEAKNATTAEKGLGWQAQEQWQKLHDLLVQYHALPKPLSDVSVVHDDQFLKDIYASGPAALQPK